MKRQYAKPLLEQDVLCLYRPPGSVVAQLVRAGRWHGAAVGYAPDTDSPLVYHRFMRTQPPVGPLAGVSEQHLLELSEDASAYEIADRIVVLLDGKVAALGERDDVWNSNDPRIRDFIERRMAEGGGRGMDVATLMEI